MKQRIAALLLMSVAMAARAGLPDSFQPIALEHPFSFSARVFDMTGAFEQSKREGRPMLVYLGAKDCPPCRLYERWLQDNRDAVAPGMSKLLIVDLRTYIKGPEIQFKIGDKRLSLQQWRKELGDESTRVLYPSWWLVTPDGKLIQKAVGSDTFETVGKYLAFIDVSGEKP